MDKTIEIILVIVVGLLVSSVMIFLAQDRTDSFSDFLGNQQQGAECSLAQTQYENQRCEEGQIPKDKSEFVPDNLEGECETGEWSGENICEDEGEDSTDNEDSNSESEPSTGR